MKSGTARTLASATTGGAGAVAGTAAYLVVGGLPGVLYAAGICLAALVGAFAIGAERAVNMHDLVAAAPLPPRLRRSPDLDLDPEPKHGQTPKAESAAVTHPEAVASNAELEEHRMALANLGAQLARESDAARRDMERLEKRIRELETERDGLLELLTEERARFEQAIEVLCDGIGTELAELEPALEALVVEP